MQNSLLVCCGCLEPLGGLALYKSHACVLLLIRNLSAPLRHKLRNLCWFVRVFIVRYFVFQQDVVNILGLFGARLDKLNSGVALGRTI
jgi:hypothetical protein